MRTVNHTASGYRDWSSPSQPHTPRASLRLRSAVPPRPPLLLLPVATYTDHLGAVWAPSQFRCAAETSFVQYQLLFSFRSSAPRCHHLQRNTSCWISPPDICCKLLAHHRLPGLDIIVCDYTVYAYTKNLCHACPGHVPLCKTNQQAYI